MPRYDNQRDEIADSLMQGKSTFDYGLAGLGTAAQMSPMSGPQMPTVPGLPATQAGGVPGSGLAAAPPSNVQLPPQRMGMMGAMPTMGGLGTMGAPGLGGMLPPGQQRRRPGMPYA